MKWCKLKWITTEIVFSCWTHWSTQSTKQIDVYLYMIQTTRRSWFHKSSTSFYEINLYHKTLTLYSNSLTTYRPIYSDFCSIGDDITLYAVTCNQHLLELLHRTSDLGFGIHVQAKSFFISSAWLYPDGFRATQCYWTEIYEWLKNSTARRVIQHLLCPCVGENWKFMVSREILWTFIESRMDFNLL